MPTSTDLRRDIAALNRRMVQDINGIWRPFDATTDSIEALRDLLPDVISAYGSAAATVSADWYDDLREERGVGGRFSAIPADITDVGAQSLIGWAASTATTDAAFAALLLGGAQRRMSNFSRETVMGSSYADSRSAGWRRTGLGECAFCRMLIGRGAVYSEASVDFASHDNCQCGAEPAFD